MTKIKDSTGRVFYHHDFWEDAKNGMYDLQSIDDDKILKCVTLLSDQEIFWDTMCQMKIDWPYCFDVNLSNKTINRRAWLGQASCCYNYGISFNITIRAWNLLEDKTKKLANNTAQKMIDLYERENEDGKNTIRNECFRRCDRTHEMDF